MGAPEMVVPTVISICSMISHMEAGPLHMKDSASMVLPEDSRRRRCRRSSERRAVAPRKHICTSHCIQTSSPGSGAPWDTVTGTGMPTRVTAGVVHTVAAEPIVPAFVRAADPGRSFVAQRASAQDETPAPPPSSIHPGHDWQRVWSPFFSYKPRGEHPCSRTDIY